LHAHGTSGFDADAEVSDSGCDRKLGAVIRQVVLKRFRPGGRGSWCRVALLRLGHVHVDRDELASVHLYEQVHAAFASTLLT
jgi:hypothetical protein